MESYQLFLESERRRRHCDIQKQSYRRRQLRLTELERQVQTLMWENRHLQNQGYRASLVPQNEHVLPPSRVSMAVQQHQSLSSQDGGQIRPFFNRMASPDISQTPYFLPELDAMKELSQRSGSETTSSNKELGAISPIMKNQFGAYSSMAESHRERDVWRKLPQKRPYSAEGIYSDSRSLDYRNTAMSEPRPKRQEFTKDSSMNLPIIMRSHELDAMKRMYSDENSTDTKITVKLEPIEITEDCAVKQQDDFSTAVSCQVKSASNKPPPHSQSCSPVSQRIRTSYITPDTPMPQRMQTCVTPDDHVSQRMQLSCITPDVVVSQRIQPLCVTPELPEYVSQGSSFGSPRQTSQDIDMAIILSEIHQLRNMVSHLQNSVDKIAERLGPEKCSEKQSSDWTDVDAGNCNDPKGDRQLCVSCKNKISPVRKAKDDFEQSDNCIIESVGTFSKLVNKNDCVGDSEILDCSQVTPCDDETVILKKNSSVSHTEEETCEKLENKEKELRDVHENSTMPTQNEPMSVDEHYGCITMEELGLEREHKQAVISSVKCLLQIGSSLHDVTSTSEKN